MALIPDVPSGTGTLLVRASYRYSRRRFGKVLAPLRVLAHNPKVMAAYGAFETIMERTAALDVRLKTLAAVKTSTLVGCPF